MTRTSTSKPTIPDKQKSCGPLLSERIAAFLAFLRLTEMRSGKRRKASAPVKPRLPEHNGNFHPQLRRVPANRRTHPGMLSDLRRSLCLPVFGDHLHLPDPFDQIKRHFRCKDSGQGQKSVGRLEIETAYAFSFIH